MTAHDNRANRFVRLRSIEQRMTLQALAKAQREAAQIETIIARIAALSSDNSIDQGFTDGRSLAAVAEAAKRLHVAHRATLAPLAQALDKVSNLQATGLRAQSRLDDAIRRAASADQAHAAQVERREAAKACFRRAPALDGSS